MNAQVFLIGAGPGDPELITVKGARCLQEADCVIYDSLVSVELLQQARPDAELIYVGKRGGQKNISQEEINALIVERGKAGKKVARLKGGDPFVFGRGGEEAEALVRAGIRYEVIPGITSGIAAPAYAGIPVTHRDFSSSVAFITGHEDPGKEESLLAWDKIATGIETLVFFMGVANLREIVENLVQHGRSGDTPIAVIQWGTHSRQEVLVGTLATIVNQTTFRKISAPAVTVVGNVVALREKLKWFEDRPLFGRRILITRPREQAEDLKSRLTELGAEVLAFPTIEIRKPSSWERLDEDIQRIDRYHWIIFTSVNGVKHFFSRYQELRRDIRDLKGIRIAAIGSATERAIKEMHLNVEVLPDEFQAEGLVQSLKGKVLKGAHVLIARAKVARDVLPMELKKQGARVNVVETYETVIPKASRERLEQLFEDRPVDMVVFTSSSTVSNLSEILKPASLGDFLQQSTIAAIGPVTAQTANRHGLTVSVQPAQYNIPSLVEAILSFYRT